MVWEWNFELIFEMRHDGRRKNASALVVVLLSSELLALHHGNSQLPAQNPSPLLQSNGSSGASRPTANDDDSSTIAQRS
jgi:hypothetical protein